MGIFVRILSSSGLMLPKKYDFRVAEPEIQATWDAEQSYKFHKDSKKPVYSIDTPPPTVNGKIHIGHLSSYSHIDIIARYKRMTGFEVFYPFGFDDNGLPTERLVEGNLGKRAHELPRQEFVEECLKQTEELEGRFKTLFKQMAQSPDWDYTYSTINAKSCKTAQKSFLDLHEKKMAFRGSRPAQWCVECRTSVSQQETETKELESTFNYIKFFFENSDSEYLEVATTRPELLPACVCVFVNPDDPVRSKFIGKKVRVPLFDFFVPVMADEKALMDKGTGVVMCCTFGDQTDYEWYEKYDLPCKVAIDGNGMMTEIADKYAGLYVLKARTAMIEDLKTNDLLYKQEPIVHAVAVHERCETALELVKKKQWFINLIDYKDEFIRMGDEINWYPENMKKRYSDWVNNIAFDWCISRQRYFGVMFPVWYCKNCGEVMVATEDELPVNPMVASPKTACGCGCTEFEPESDIMDTWMTSSVSPLINLDWVGDFKKEMLPMGLRPNAHDIIRTWDFDTIVKMYHHFGCIPWKDVMISGFVMASKTEKFSKKKKNAKMEPQYLLDTYSSDITRYWTPCSSNGNDVVFSEDEFLKGRKLVNKLYNAAKFTLMFIEDYKPDKAVKLCPMDRWIIGTYNDMFNTYTRFMSNYMMSPALKMVERFFWNFCDNYIEIVKNRLYKPEVYGEEAKVSGQWTCYYVLLNMLKCFAPVMPHITEYIFKEAFISKEDERTIHLSQQSKIDIDASDACNGGDEFIEILGIVRGIKSTEKLSVNTPIALCTIMCKNLEFIESAVVDLKAVCQIAEVVIKKGKETEVQVEFATQE